MEKQKNQKKEKIFMANRIIVFSDYVYGVHRI